MKKYTVAFAALALLSSAALAGSNDGCVDRILKTNYNSGLEGQLSSVCVGVGSAAGQPVKEDCKR